MVLTDVKRDTDLVFGDEMGLKKLVVPEPPIIWKDRLQALEEAKLTNHRVSCLYDMRCWQAKEMGFKQFTSDELVELLMRKNPTEKEDGKERQVLEYVYNHHDDVTLSKEIGWGSNPTIFSRYDRKGFWHLPPFSKIKLWECQFGKLDYLKRDIPYGVVLRINECKELKLFNWFQVIAPLEAWERKTDIDPIVIATIAELPLNEKGKISTAGQTAFFFIAQW